VATRVFQFTVTIPSGTPKSAPATSGLTLDGWDLEMIDLEVPPGPAGLMGFYVANNGVQWIPQGDGEWLVWDDVQHSWPLTDQPNASGWEIVGYNLGDYDHIAIVRMHVSLPGSQSASASPPTVTFVSTPVQQPAVILT
jgi:hypothetical protein